MKKRKFLGTLFTSTMGQVGGKNRTGNGTVKRPASQVLKHPERWSYTEHEVTDKMFANGMLYAEWEVKNNKGYGVFNGKNVCSKVSHNFNAATGELPGPVKFVDPLHDALLMVQAGKEIKPLQS